jgi:tRNA pseudouridine55 synthase
VLIVVNGILVINKPSGPTSFAIVARVKRLTGEKRVGHGGTLDPLASGVLPVFLGQATRLVEYLQEYPKTYRAGVLLGVSTDTYDAEGKITGEIDIARYFQNNVPPHPAAAVSLNPDELLNPNLNRTTQPGRAAQPQPSGATSFSNSSLLSVIDTLLPSFLGEILQVPPAYSALKKDGQPMYKLAREGQAPEIEARKVTIYRLEIVDFQPPLLTLDVECSKGTYIRSLAHDLGQKLGVGAHLKSLIRTAYGSFDIKNAFTLEQLEEAAVIGSLESFLQPMDSVLSFWPLVVLTPEQELDVRQGKQLALSPGCHAGGQQPEASGGWGGPQSQPFALSCVSIGSRLRAYSGEGAFIALLSLDSSTGLWQPDKVFKPA